MPETTFIDITPDPATRALFAGIAAGSHAHEGVLKLGDAPLVNRRMYFWLLVGTRLAQEVPDANEEQVAAFVQGAGQHQPDESEPVLTLHLDSIDGAAFGTAQVSDGLEYDYNAARQESASVLSRVARQLAGGHDEGDLTDSTGNRVGGYKFNPYI